MFVLLALRLTRSIFVGPGERYPAYLIIRFWRLA
jgi:hypothetical protein